MRPEADPALHLLAEVAAAPEDRVLLMEGGPGELLARLAARPGETVCHNSDVRSHRAAEESLASLGPGSARCLLGDLPRAAREGAEPWPGVLEFPPGHFDLVLCRLGKGTASLHAALREAWSLLRRGGALCLAGHTREGIKSLAKRAEGHFGNLEILAIKSSCRLLRLRKGEGPPPDPIPDPMYWNPFLLDIRLPDGSTFPYLSKPGLFAYRETDPGTALLAANLPRMDGARVLDLGCGSGVLSLAAHRLGAREVVATDVSAAASAVARRNFAEAGVSGTVVCADLAQGLEGTFDRILANPPFHQGPDTDYGLPGKILDAALPLLGPEGRMFLVANQFLDYPAQAARRAHACETLAHGKGFKVYKLAR